MTMFRRRDAWWEQEGRPARARRRQQRFMSSVALMIAIAATAMTATMWWLQGGRRRVPAREARDPLARRRPCPAAPAESPRPVSFRVRPSHATPRFTIWRASARVGTKVSATSRGATG